MVHEVNVGQVQRLQRDSTNPNEEAKRKRLEQLLEPKTVSPRRGHES
jgi:hypothetical protein